MPTTFDTTISEFSHADRPGRIALVGNRHYGSPLYVALLGHRLSTYEATGSRIHFEGVSAATEEGLESLTIRQRRSYDVLHGLLDFSKRVHGNGELVSIKLAMRQTEAWENHDTSIEDLVRRANLRQHLALGAMGAMYNLYQWAGGTPEQMYPVMYSAGNRPTDDMRRRSMLGTMIMGTIEPLIVDYRNSIAVSAVDAAVEAAPDQSLALLWGQGHVPGITRDLEKRGYSQQSLETFDPFM